MKDWTMMVYMAGDNDLEVAAHRDLLEMTEIGSGERVNVVVQSDSRQGGTICYFVEAGCLQLVGEPLRQTNTGDPAVLAEFVRWARATYPAHHYILIIWNHGTGWENVPSTFDWRRIQGSSTGKTLNRSIFSTLQKASSQPSEERAIALDATSRDFLDNDELDRGLAEGLAGDKLDILGFDACLMGMVEIAYQLRDQAHFIVASQETEPLIGWPYHAILDLLSQHPEITPRTLSKSIVKLYGDMGVKARARTKYTQSALDLAQVGTTFRLIQQFAGCLDALYPTRLAVRRAINEASREEDGAKRFADGNCVDLYDWIRRVRRYYTGDDEELQANLDALLNHLTPGAKAGLVIASAAEVGDDREQIHGVSIYLPQYERYSNLYEKLDFSETGWGTFAQKVSEMLE